MSIRTRILKVGAAKSLELIIVTFVRFASVPLFLYAWSPELYGEWLMLFSLLTYFSLGKLGFAQAAANEMTISVARDDRTAAIVTYQTVFAVTIAVSAILVGSGCLMAWQLPLDRILNIELIKADELRLILLCFLIYISASFFITLYLAAYRCEGLYHRGIVLFNLSALSEFVILVLVLVSVRGPLALALSMLIVRILAFIIIYIDMRFSVPWLEQGLTKLSKKELTRILWPSLSFAAFPAAQTVLNQGVIIGIGIFLGPIAVVLFNSLRTLTNLVTWLFGVVNQAFYPEISMAWGTENRALLRKLHRLSCQASLWLGLAATMFLTIFGPWVFEKWTQGKVSLDMMLLWGFLVLLVLRSLWYTSYIVPSGINQHQKLTVIFLLASIFGLGISLALLQKSLFLGLTGFVACEIIMIFVVVRQSLDITQDKAANFLSTILKPPKLSIWLKAIIGNTAQ